MRHMKEFSVFEMRVSYYAALPELALCNSEQSTLYYELHYGETLGYHGSEYKENGSHTVSVMQTA